MFSRSDWAGMDEDQRRESLQGIETREAVEQGRPAATVISHDYDDPRVCGHYDPNNNEIHINSNDIRADQPDEALDTVYHEGRHAYQHSEAANPEVADNPEYAQQCKDGLGDNYINYQEDPEGYENQFVEQDARGYAQDKVNDYNQNEGQYHSGLYNDNQSQNNTNEASESQESSEGENYAYSY